MTFCGVMCWLHCIYSTRSYMSLFRLNEAWGRAPSTWACDTSCCHSQCISSFCHVECREYSLLCIVHSTVSTMLFSFFAEWAVSVQWAYAEDDRTECSSWMCVSGYRALVIHRGDYSQAFCLGCVADRQTHVDIYWITLWFKAAWGSQRCSASRLHGLVGSSPV